MNNKRVIDVDEVKDGVQRVENEQEQDQTLEPSLVATRASGKRVILGDHATYFLYVLKYR